MTPADRVATTGTSSSGSEAAEIPPSADSVSITIAELNGRSHVLGSFGVKEGIQQIFLRTCETMHVPAELVQLALGDGSPILERCNFAIGALGLGPQANLTVMIQIPANVRENVVHGCCLIRSSAYRKLAELGCSFQQSDDITSTAVNVLTHIVTMLRDGLSADQQPVARDAAIEALSKLSQHCYYLSESDAGVRASLEQIAAHLAQGSGLLLRSQSWAERQQACCELGYLGDAAVSEIDGLAQCCKDANKTVQTDAYKTLSRLVGNGLRIPSCQRNRIAELLASGLRASPPIDEWACRALSCLGDAAAPYVDTLRERLDGSIDFCMRRAVRDALEKLATTEMQAN